MRTDDGRRGKIADGTGGTEVMIKLLENDYALDTITYTSMIFLPKTSTGVNKYNIFKNN